MSRGGRSFADGGVGGIARELVGAVEFVEVEGGEGVVFDLPFPSISQYSTLRQSFLLYVCGCVGSGEEVGV